MKRNILFIDGDVNALKGIKRIFHRFRNEWVMSFCASGKDALATLNSRPIDVVVSEMRLPDMDDGKMLTEIHHRFPKTARIILSGYTDQNLIINSIKHSHQFLAKPVNENDLKLTIDRACAIRDLLTEDNLQEIVTNTVTLPSLPSLYQKIQNELLKEDACVHNISEILAKDIGMTAKILQLVNSAYFGLPRQISSVKDAVMLLGLETLKALLLTLELFSHSNREPKFTQLIEKIQNHSLRTASIAKQIAIMEKFSKQLIENTFIAGVLHDVGKLILINNFKNDYLNVLKKGEETKLPLVVLEKEAFGANHCEIGAYLLGLWGMRSEIVESLLFHHHPQQFPHDSITAFSAVYIANSIEHGLSNPSQKPIKEMVDLQYIASIQFESKLGELENICKDLFNQ